LWENIWLRSLVAVIAEPGGTGLMLADHRFYNQIRHALACNASYIDR